MEFQLWMETEEVAEPATDFCNILVTFPDGERWPLNVWTFDFFDTARRHPEIAVSAELESVCMLPPDLFVKDLSRSTIESVLRDMISRGTAPSHWVSLDSD